MGTKKKILDAAETLIVALGEENVSLRKITAEAGVNVASVNYHFGSRNNLITAVLHRILSPLRDEMLCNLRELEEKFAPEPPPVEDFIRAYLEPTLLFSERFPNYEKMFMHLARSYDEPDQFKLSVRNVVEETLKPYGECLVRIFPELERERVLLKMAFFRNTALGIMQGNCLMEESLRILGLDPGMDRRQMMHEMVLFISAGMRA